MSKPGTIYRITNQAFDPDNDIQIITDISDNDNLIADDATANTINLTGSGKPKELSTIDNSEDPLTVVKAQQFVIEFLSSNDADMNTFASGSDQRWGVHSYRATDEHTIFKGFLVMDDMSEDYMPEPNIVVLTANDGLGLLKDIPLTDFDGINPTMYNRIIDYIAWALSKTGLQLQINVAFNIKNEGYATDISIPGTNAQHFYDINFLDAKTFEDKIGTCINCYDVLQRILGEEARLFQWQGKWWIMRVDEVEHPTRGLYISTFSYLGEPIANLGMIHFDKQILNTEDTSKVYWLREQTRVIPSRPLKSLKLTHQYETPLELPCNVGFERGNVIDESDPLEKTYKVECWILREATISTPATHDTAFIRKTFNSSGYELERYAVIGIASNTDEYFLSSENIPVEINDKFDFSVDVKYQGQIDTGSGFFRRFVASIRLFGDDGTYYFLNGGTSADPTPYWIATNAGFSINSRGFVIEGDGNDDDTVWKTAAFWGGAECPSIPKTGTIQIVLRHNYKVDSFEIDFGNLRFDYIPYINGTYQKYTGQSQTITQNGDYKAKRDKQVYIGNLPKQIFKGALHTVSLYNEVYNDTAQFFTDGSFKIAGDYSSIFSRNQRLLIQDTALNNQFCVIKTVTYHVVGDETEILTNGTMLAETITAKLSIASFQLSGNFYNAVVWPDATGAYYFPYGEIQAFDVWNQFKNDMRVFQAVCQGLELNSNGDDGLITNLHLISKIRIPDITPNTNDRTFSILTFNMDLRTCEWSGTMREIWNSVREKDYASARVFKYEQ